MLNDVALLIEPEDVDAGRWRSRQFRYLNATVRVFIDWAASLFERRAFQGEKDDDRLLLARHVALEGAHHGRL
ncbi:hypothetical protein ACG02S_25365 [Roseateles sp. DC23W]|uniref:Uncharacterized protein n=1 Tax=Pelomonas dachongensis TaxID=3299029 RepID=A0ABW7EVS8_9BURK